MDVFLNMPIDLFASDSLFVFLQDWAKQKEKTGGFHGAACKIRWKSVLPIGNLSPKYG